MHHYLAIDLGAGSGRLLLGSVDQSRIELSPVHRFQSPMRPAHGHLRWDFAQLVGHLREGLRHARSGPRAASIGVDTWGVDFGLLDENGVLIEDPVAYRDSRTDGVDESVHRIVPRPELFRRTGIQWLPFNTVYQWYAQVKRGEWPARTRRLLMMPDLVNHWLCGARTGEYTQATTSSLVDVATRDWDRELCRKLGLPDEVLPALRVPGERLGGLRESLRVELGLPAMEVVLPATHDTASAVLGAPLVEGDAYISSGTWSLVGVELAQPVLDAAALRDNFTNEGGAYRTVRLLKNVAGMWILEGCRASWNRRGLDLPYDELMRGVATAAPFQALIAPDDPAFLHPDDMLDAVQQVLAATGQPFIEDPAALTRVLLESAALRYAMVLERVAALTGKSVRRVRIIGGGSRNDFLNQATADASGLPVLAGPVEATALGNVLVQTIVNGQFRDLIQARCAVESSFPPRRFEPHPDRMPETLRARFAALHRERCGGG